MKTLLSIFTVLFLTLLPAHSKPPALPQELVAALAANPEVTLYSLQPRGGPDLPEWDFHGHHILGQIVLNPDQAKIALQAFHDAVAAGRADVYASCIFEPRHALRLKSNNGATYDLVICYQCGQLDILKGAAHLDFPGSIGGKPGALNALLTAAKIPLADTPAALDESYREEAKTARQRAEAGDPQAQNVLARLLMRGQGLKKNEAEGILWLAKSLSLAPDSAAYLTILGRMYESGHDLTENLPAALATYRQAADLGSAEAMYELGQCYEFGIGVPKDETTAAKWFRQSAEKGYSEAQFSIGVSHAKAQDGFPQDYPQALQWLQKAAAQNHPQALFWMGNMYEEGWGVPKDLVEAEFWFALAREYHTVYGRNTPQKKLTPAQSATIKKRIADWVATHKK
jgi:TPR repeat protein